MILLITTDHRQYLQKHAEQTYPEECCGLLLGIHQSLEGAMISVIREVYPTLNVWEQNLADPDQPNPLKASAHRHYRINPTAMLNAQQYARAKNWDIM
jgi:proteasome lid subunit RPN8/RPN11